MIFYHSKTAKRSTRRKNEPLDRRTISECLLKIGGLIILLICVMGAAMIYFGLDKGDGVNDGVTIGGIVMLCLIPFIAGALIWFSCRHFCSTHITDYHDSSHDSQQRPSTAAVHGDSPWPQRSPSMIDVTSPSACPTPATEESLTHRDGSVTTLNDHEKDRSFSSSDDSGLAPDDNDRREELAEDASEATSETLNDDGAFYPPVATPPSLSPRAQASEFQEAAAAPARAAAQLAPSTDHAEDNEYRPVSLFERRDPPHLSPDFLSANSAQSPRSPTLVDEFFGEKY